MSLFGKKTVNEEGKRLYKVSSMGKSANVFASDEDDARIKATQPPFNFTFPEIKKAKVKPL